MSGIEDLDLQEINARLAEMDARGTWPGEAGEYLALSTAQRALQDNAALTAQVQSLREALEVEARICREDLDWKSCEDCECAVALEEGPCPTFAALSPAVTEEEGE
jgi:hypothetical protein